MINFRLPDATAEIFDRRVKADGRSVTEVMVSLVQDWLGGNGTPSVTPPRPPVPRGMTVTIAPKRKRPVLVGDASAEQATHVNRLKGHWKPR